MLDALLCAFHHHCAHLRGSESSTAPRAVATACPEDFQGGRPPALVNPKVAASTYPLCLAGFATLFSGITRTPVYSAEHLTATRVDDPIGRYHDDRPFRLRSLLGNDGASGRKRGKKSCWN